MTTADVHRRADEEAWTTGAEHPRSSESGAVRRPSNGPRLAVVIGAALVVMVAVFVGDWLSFGLGAIIVLVAAVLAFTAVVLIRHRRLRLDHQDLRLLHGFSTAIGGPDAVDIGLAELAATFETQAAAIVVPDERGSIDVRFISDSVSRSVTVPGEPLTAEAAVDLAVAQVYGHRGWAETIGHRHDGPAFMVVIDGPCSDHGLRADRRRLLAPIAVILGRRLSADGLLDGLGVGVDPLTGVANRSRLKEAVDQSRAESGTSGVVAVADLDQFNDVNELYGHNVGDFVLRVLAERLLDETREFDTVARIGGDEFGVVLRGMGLDIPFDSRLAHLAARVGRPVTIGGTTIELGLAMGFARWPDDVGDGAELLRKAGVALAEANRTRRRLLSYEPAIDNADPEATALRGDLRRAIEAGQIEVYLQPQVRAADLQVVAAEALVRWHHPRMGLIPPDRFMPWAERSPLAGELTGRILDVALAASARLQAEGLPLALSINLTSRDLLTRDLAPQVARAAAKAGVDPGSLTFEVTENSLITDLAAAIDTLTELQALGCRTAADDFGTGYASLQYLQQLPLNEVKIDRSFVTGAAENANDEAIVRSTTKLLHDLGLEVVAEGVEDAATCELTRLAGCDLLQGEMFSSPLPLNAFVNYLSARKSPTRRPSQHPPPERPTPPG